jgi:hypothetical protein
MDIVETIFLNLIQKYRVEDLRKAINEDVDLAALTCQYAGQLVKVGRVYAKLFGSSEKDDLTAENLIFYMRTKRPDLYNELTLNPKGRPWLKKNIEGFKKVLWGN